MEAMFKLKSKGREENSGQKEQLGEIPECTGERVGAGSWARGTPGAWTIVLHLQPMLGVWMSLFWKLPVSFNLGRRWHQICIWKDSLSWLSGAWGVREDGK